MEYGKKVLIISQKSLEINLDFVLVFWKTTAKYLRETLDNSLEREQIVVFTTELLQSFIDSLAGTQVDKKLTYQIQISPNYFAYQDKKGQVRFGSIGKIDPSKQIIIPPDAQLSDEELYLALGLSAAEPAPTEESA